MLKEILFNIYVFSAILSFFLLVRLSWDVSKALNEKLEVNFGWSLLKLALLTFIENFFYITIPGLNTIIAIMLVFVMLSSLWENLIDESINKGVNKAKAERGISDEEFDALIEKFKNENENE